MWNCKSWYRSDTKWIQDQYRRYQYFLFTKHFHVGENFYQFVVFFLNTVYWSKITQVFAPLCLCHDCIVWQQSVPLSLLLLVLPSHVTARWHSRAAEKKNQSVQCKMWKEFTQTCLFSDETGASWQLLNVEYWSRHPSIDPIPILDQRHRYWDWVTHPRFKN